MGQTRRSFIHNAGIGLLTFCVDGCDVDLSPREARARGADFGVLSANEVVSIDALGEILVPGSTVAGLAHFIDHQLGTTVDQQLLMIKYLGINPPFLPFYRGALAALEAGATTRHGASFAELDADAKAAFVAEIAKANPQGWEGPAAPFFHFVLRADAVDVVYGTKDGIERLGLPYMAHIEPPSRWGG